MISREICKEIIMSTNARRSFKKARVLSSRYKLYLKPTIIKQERLINKEKKHYGKKCIRVIWETRPEQVDNY